MKIYQGPILAAAIVANSFNGYDGPFDKRTEAMPFTSNAPKYYVHRHMRFDSHPLPVDQHALHTPQASTIVLHYESALNTYKPYSDQPVQFWREANELVGNIGGWRAYAREAAAEEDASESDAPPSPHEHHHGEVQP